VRNKQIRSETSALMINKIRHPRMEMINWFTVIPSHKKYIFRKGLVFMHNKKKERSITILQNIFLSIYCCEIGSKIKHHNSFILTSTIKNRQVKIHVTNLIYIK
jgi:hypothetical protein